MSCAERDADLQAFLDGELSPSKALVVQRHIDVCPLCQNRLQVLHDVRSELRAHAATYRAPQSLKEQLHGRLRRAERRRRAWHAVVAMLALALLVGGTGLYWLYTGPMTPSLVTELVGAHAAIVQGEITLAFPSADRALVRHWLEQQLPFQPVIPRADWGGFQLLGARTLTLSDQEGAFLLFGRGDRKVSLVSLPDPPPIPGYSTQVEMDGMRFWFFVQGVYTFVLWSEHALLYVMVSDDEVDESLEHARLCAQQIRAPS